MKAIFSLIFLLAMIFNATGQGDAQEVVNRAIAAHGGDHYQQVQIEFDFRGRHYFLKRDMGIFEYQRRYSHEGRKIVDRLNNTGFQRRIDGEAATLTAEDSSRYANSLNSVFYFAILPFPLQDPAVQSRYLAEVSLAGKRYHKIEVTFRQDGGGKDFQDVFIYWFNTETNLLDYMAYSFHVNGGGIRFRKARNPRVIEGIRLVDYDNYKPLDAAAPLEKMDSLFENGKLKKVSEINLENLRVARGAVTPAG